MSDLFFSSDVADLETCRAICGECAWREPCLAGAIERAEPFGVWGGKLFRDGVPLDGLRKRGRPPKHAPDVHAVV